MRAILLARVSTEDQETIQQIESLKEYIGNNPELELQDKDIFEFDESASKDIALRKKFQKVLDELQAIEVDTALICDKVDRLTRDFLRFMPTFEELRKKGNIFFHFPSDNLKISSNSPAADLFRFNMAVALAQYYSNAISDNVKRKIAQKIREGTILTKAPFGYDNVTLEDESKAVQVNDYEANIVLKMFEWYSTGNYSYTDIKNKVYEVFAHKFGKSASSKSTVGNILTNKFYIGIATYKRKGIEYPHIYEKIVPEHLYNKVQEIREGNMQWKGGNTYASRKFYYRGLINCHECGYSLSPEKQRGKAYYCCTEYGGKHGAKYVSEKLLSKHFKKAFERLSLDKKTAQKIMTELKFVNQDNLIISEQFIYKLREEQAKYKKMKSKLYDDYASGSITEDFYLEKLKQYDRELDRIADRLTSIEKVDKEFYVTAGYIIQLAKHSAELFERSEYSERIELINIVLSNVTWDGEKLHYDYNSPFHLLANLNESTSWGGWRDLNPRHPAPQAGVLPLNYNHQFCRRTK